MTYFLPIVVLHSAFSKKRMAIGHVLAEVFHSHELGCANKA